MLGVGPDEVTGLEHMPGATILPFRGNHAGEKAESIGKHGTVGGTIVRSSLGRGRLIRGHACNDSARSIGDDHYNFLSHILTCNATS